MKISLRVKLITSFLIVVVITGCVATFTGIHLINDRIIKQAQEKIAKEATRCKDIVKGLLDFARQTEPKLELSNINSVIEEVLSLVGKQPLFMNIQILKELNLSIPMIMIDRSQIQQVFTNILVNAGEAMSEGSCGKENGKLTIKTTTSPDSLFVKISFTDTGCGISRENIGKIFDPFFTTKKAGKGTGLGLAVSYGIVQRHNGNIEVVSELGKGTTFTVNLPINKK
ncbi:MAG: ATP-binding protein [bacterium]|nr:ATP-binding protein [bacterium]